MNWIMLATRVPLVVHESVKLLNRMKGAGADKKKALLESLPDAIGVAELAADRDLFNDPAVSDLIGALIDAEAAVQKAREALKAGLLAKR